MAFFRKKKTVNLGNVSIGATDVPTKVDESDASVSEKRKEIEKDTERKVSEYRKSNPEKPKDDAKKRSLESPLKIKRSIGSFDNEYIEIAKRYLGMPSEKKPTVVELSKGIIKLFEDNLKLYKEISRLKDAAKPGIRSRSRHSWEQNSSWN